MATLLVEREILHVDGTRTLEDGGGEPRDVAIVRDYYVRTQHGGVVVAVSTVMREQRHQGGVALWLSAM